MYHIGDKVMHKSTGACYVTDIVSMSADNSKKKQSYYKLEPILDSRSTIYVLIDEAKSLRTRPVISSTQLSEQMLSIQKSDGEWIENQMERQKAALESIKSFDFLPKGKFLKMLIKRSTEKNLNVRDKEVLNNIMVSVYSELAIIQNRSYEDVALENPLLDCNQTSNNGLSSFPDL